MGQDKRDLVCFASAFRINGSDNITHVTLNGEHTLCGRTVWGTSEGWTVPPGPDCLECRELHKLGGPVQLGQWIEASTGEIGQVAVYDPQDSAATYAVITGGGDSFTLADVGLACLEGIQILSGLPTSTLVAWVGCPVRVLTPEELAAHQLASGVVGL